MKDALLKYVEPVYRFCLSRLSSRADSEDLSQEILLCIAEGLKRQKIMNLDGYVWRVAHNRYARKIAACSLENTMLCGEEYLLDIADDTPFEDGLDAEEYQLVFKALHSLSSMYRDILVDYYVRELDTFEIAQKYEISVETVKWRLHTGREKMKVRLNEVNKTYGKIKMHVMCNGSFAPNQYLSNQIQKAIAAACYEKPLTIEEISLATGIPTLYLDEVLSFMVYGDALEKVGNKYQTDFIILHNSDNKRLQSSLQPSVQNIAARVWDTIENNISRFCNIGFYGADFSAGRLAHILVPILLRIATDQVKQENPAIMPHNRPLRKDGGNGWFLVTEGVEGLDENFAGCNVYDYKDTCGNDIGRLLQYWIGASFDEDLSISLRDAGFFIDHINLVTGEFNSKNEEDTAKAIRLHLIEKIDAKYYSVIPIFTKNQYKSFLALSSHGIAELLKVWMLSLYKEYKAFTPKRLAEQIAGNVDSYSFNVAAFVMNELQVQGKIEVVNADTVMTYNMLLVKE